MRVVHLTDLHCEARPTLGELANKRLLGAINLYVLGRADHFTRASVEGAVAAVVAAAPDLVVCTGDLTATATEAEFALARELLRPLTDRFPFLCLPGNHDVYTGESAGRFARWFGEWSQGGRFPWSVTHGGVEFVLVDTAFPDWLSRGRAEGLDALDALLAAGAAPAWVLLHYPLRDRHGAPYGPSTRNLINAAAVEAVLGRHPRVRAVLHGHEHHGYRTEIPTPHGPIPSLDPGASGYAWLPRRHRTAHLNVYDVARDGGFTVDRLAWDGSRFAPETGGAYATGG